MHTFEIAACREIKPDFPSRCIMWFTKSRYSHVLIIMDNQWVFHAVGKGVCMEPLYEILKEHELPIRMAVEPQAPKNPDIAYGYLLGSEGLEYSQSQYLGFLFKPFRKYVKNGRARMICSEFVVDFIQRGLGYKTPDCVPDFCSPIDAINLVRRITLK